ncbi:MAG TPA: sugar transferase [Acidobacteriaceae bacterium]|nr:sugar transferase [Acidobacteriaceae bacterium]
MTPLHVENAASIEGLLSGAASGAEREVLSEDAFRRRIAVERKRTERSKEPFLLMLLEGDDHQSPTKNGRALDKVMSALLPSTRETDVIGWYKERTTIGVMFTGLAPADKSTVLGTILGRISSAVRSELTFEQFSQISISFHLFPDDWDQDDSGEPRNPALYPDMYVPDSGRRAMFGVKRLMDIVGSSLLLFACLPLFMLIAMVIKVTSRGPVFFRQQRVGQYGRRFTFLKFRSMYVNNDHSVHREYVKKLIAGNAERIALNGNSEGVYKLANDRRITEIGKILRRTSLDELPQFINVLLGDMSLVGPRPPIPYELAAYQTWHRRRLQQVKPGITGLWQVTGRSRVTFDDMVRLDLHYATTWSPWLDFKILMRTPAAVIKGAY